MIAEMLWGQGVKDREQHTHLIGTAWNTGRIRDSCKGSLIQARRKAANKFCNRHPTFDQVTQFSTRNHAEIDVFDSSQRMSVQSVFTGL